MREDGNLCMDGKSGLRIQKECCHDTSAALNVFAFSPLPPLLSHTPLVFSRSHTTGMQRYEIETELSETFRPTN